MNLGMEKPYVVGIDIGGTNTVFGIVDTRGTILSSGAVKTQTYATATEYVEKKKKNLLPLIIAQGGIEKIKGIGIGAPNGNYYSGTIEFAPNLPWKGIIPLAAMFEEKLGIPTALTNDANAAAVGEMTYGAARGMKDFIMITLGTGVGSGIVINGQVVYGHDGFAGDLDFSQHIRILCLDGFDQSAVEIIVWFEPGQDCGPLQLFASDDDAFFIQLEHDDRSGSQLPCPFAYRNSAVSLQFVVFIAEMSDLKKAQCALDQKSADNQNTQCKHIVHLFRTSYLQHLNKSLCIIHFFQIIDQSWIIDDLKDKIIYLHQDSLLLLRNLLGCH
mgnify:CR=1 FL=1